MTTTTFSLNHMSKKTLLQTSGASSSNTLNNVQVYDVVGYSPTDFLTSAAAQNFNTQPGLSAADGTPLRIPVNALVISASIRNNGIAIVAAGAHNVGINTTAAANNSIFGSVTTVIINRGGYVQNIAATNALDNTGAIAAIAPAGAASNFITMNPANPITGGGIVIFITYILGA